MNILSLIDRTIYPKFHKKITKRELQKYYTPSKEEIRLAHDNVKGENQICVFLVLLKTFNILHYFPQLKQIPLEIFNYIRILLNINVEKKFEFKERSTVRYKKIIRKYYNVTSNKEYICSTVLKAIELYEPLLENTADIFNAVIENLIKQNCELPAFSSLERWITNTRAKLNNDIFEFVENNLNEYDKKAIDLMFIPNERGLTNFNYMKQLPKSPTLKHMKELKNNYIYLSKINIGRELICSISPSKINFFAAQAKSLDASEMKDFAGNKRYTIMICFLYYNTVKAGDNLATMFIKRIAKIHNKAKENLEVLLDKQRAKTEHLIETFYKLLTVSSSCDNSEDFSIIFNKIINSNGGISNLINDCEEISAYNRKNYYLLMWNSFKSHRKILFEILKLLCIKSTVDDPIIKCMNYLLKCETKKSEFVSADVNISFVNEKWQKLIKYNDENNNTVFSRKYFEMCIFSYIASQLKTGDLYIEPSQEYADYRKQLLPWDECEKQLFTYCKQMNIPDSKEGFINNLKAKLSKKSTLVDKNYSENNALIIENNQVLLKKSSSKNVSKDILQFKELIEKHMPERSIIEILCDVEHWLNYTKHFGSLSGTEAKFKNPIERYILLIFGYGSNMGPAETSKHVRGNISPHMIHFTNKRHITEEKLDKAIADIVNCYNKFSLPKLWGDPKRVAADGTKLDVYTENLLSEYHIRYGGFGGIAYHHVSDTYIALFSHFIPCGVWEAVYIIDGLLENKSDIKPDTIHADTQGQSTPVFALTYLLGIKLMPRIRNWKDLKFFKADANIYYKNIETLFKDSIDWDIIASHYKELFQIVLSINAGKIMPSTLLRKLNNYSKKNKLYQAFRELGNVIRTIYLLDFISDSELRIQITESTNKAEAYNGFSKWFFFAGEGIICENDLEEQSKIIKYNDLLSNAVILHNIVDINIALEKIGESNSFPITREELKSLSPYMTSHIKRFGEYIIDMNENPEPMKNIDVERFISNS